MFLYVFFLIQISAIVGGSCRERRRGQVHVGLGRPALQPDPGGDQERQPEKNRKIEET